MDEAEEERWRLRGGVAAAEGEDLSVMITVGGNVLVC